MFIGKYHNEYCPTLISQKSCNYVFCIFEELKLWRVKACFVKESERDSPTVRLDIFKIFNQIITKNILRISIAYLIA